MRKESCIDYVELPSSNLQQTKEFFTELFGWKFVDWGDDYCSFNDGRLDGGFYKSNATSTTKNGSVLLVFYSEELEHAVGRVENAGGKIVKPIFSFPGGRRFHFTDPNGNEFAIWSDK